MTEKVFCFGNSYLCWVFRMEGFDLLQNLSHTLSDVCSQFLWVRAGSMVVWVFCCGWRQLKLSGLNVRILPSYYRHLFRPIARSTGSRRLIALNNIRPIELPKRKQFECNRIRPDEANDYRKPLFWKPSRQKLNITNLNSCVNSTCRYVTGITEIMNSIQMKI